MSTLKIVHLGPQYTTRITDASVVTLSAIKSLETVSVIECRLSWEKSLSKLKELPALKLLELHSDVISDDDLARLKAELPSVKIDYKAPTDEQREWIRKAYDAPKK